MNYIYIFNNFIISVKYVFQRISSGSIWNLVSVLTAYETLLIADSIIEYGKSSKKSETLNDIMPPSQVFDKSGLI